MAQFLNNLLTASIHGSIAILAVVILRLLLCKTPKKYICLLWLLAGIRLLLPIQIRSELSLQPEFTVPASWNWPAVLPFVWGAVAVGFGIYSLVSYLQLKKQVREAVRIRGGWECDKIDTAFILGFIKPQIYIPSGMNWRAKQHILEHERTHLDKGDHWIKCIGFLALALHWFNPLVWLAYILLCRDIEMACDERVVQFMELDERKDYSAALLSCSSSRAHFAASPVAFGEVSVKQRILSILNYKKPSFWISLLGVLAFCFVAICLVTSPAKEAAPVVVTDPEGADSPFTGDRWLESWGIVMSVDDDLLTRNGAEVWMYLEEHCDLPVYADNEYWLEKQTDSGWEAMEMIAQPEWEAANYLLDDVDATIVYVDWSALYGPLPGGNYRMVKDFTLDGQTRTIYCEFTIHHSNNFSTDQDAAVERCYAALDELKTRPVIHFKGRSDWTEEMWIAGSDYLYIAEWDDHPYEGDNRGRVDILLRKDDVGYCEMREDPQIRGSKVLGLQVATLYPHSAEWNWSFEDNCLEIYLYDRDNHTITFPEGIGVISEEMIRFQTSYEWEWLGDTIETVAIITYEFDSKGNLCRMEYVDNGGKDCWVEIYDTPVAEIKAKIDTTSENLAVDTFSWEADKAKYTSGKFDIKQDRFFNNGDCAIVTALDATRLALKEYPTLLDYLSLSVSRDEEAGMWKVTIESYVLYQETYEYRDIYINDAGATQLLVYEGPVHYTASRK